MQVHYKVMVSRARMQYKMTPDSIKKVSMDRQQHVIELHVSDKWFWSVWGGAGEDVDLQGVGLVETQSFREATSVVRQKKALYAPHFLGNQQIC